jgi:hypothetical protein
MKAEKTTNAGHCKSGIHLAAQLGEAATDTKSFHGVALRECVELL